MVKISVGELHAMAEGAAEWGWLSGYLGHAVACLSGVVDGSGVDMRA